jgi:nucleoside-diphosphate-sugar epimerase
MAEVHNSTTTVPENQPATEPPHSEVVADLPETTEQLHDTSNPRNELILITGGSGFVAAHCILQCLTVGYNVRTTLRSSSREADVRAMLEASSCPNLNRLSFIIADLKRDEGWTEAVEGCTYVLHIASPFPPGAPKHEDELIVPARDGTLRVLKAAAAAGAKRVVLTSSFAAIGYGHIDHAKDTPFTEAMWTNPDGPGVNAYIRSKCLAERAAWDYVKQDDVSLELATICPTGIYGPVMGKDFATSVQLVERLMNGSLPGCPQLNFGIVDVRDVADLHMRAMLDPKAAGERFLCVSPPSMTVLEMSLTLRKELGDKAKKCPTRNLPNILLRAIAFFDKTVALIIPELGGFKDMSNEKARTVLGWEPRSATEALVATAESLVQFGVLKV